MARWTLAGSAGAVIGPLLVAAVLADGGSWRQAFVAVAALLVPGVARGRGGQAAVRPRGLGPVRG